MQNNIYIREFTTLFVQQDCKSEKETLTDHVHYMLLFPVYSLCYSFLEFKAILILMFISVDEFYVHSQNCEKRLLDSLRLALRPSVRLFTLSNGVSTGRIFVKFRI